MKFGSAEDLPVNVEFTVPLEMDLVTKTGVYMNHKMFLYKYNKIPSFVKTLKDNIKYVCLESENSLGMV